MEERAIGIENLAGQVLDGLLCFIRDHLRPGAVLEEEQALDQSQGLIRDEMGRITALVAARLARIEPELAARAVVVCCPDCRHDTLPIDHSDLHELRSVTWKVLAVIRYTRLLSQNVPDMAPTPTRPANNAVRVSVIALRRASHRCDAFRPFRVVWSHGSRPCAAPSGLK